MTERPHLTYLRRAREVEALAQRIEFQFEREAMLGIAAQWRRMAAEVMRREGIEDEA